MVLSLASLVKYATNVVFKYHNILRILLSWYAFIHQNFKTISKTQDTLMSRLESINMTNFQTENRLEKFLVKHCYSSEELK